MAHTGGVNSRLGIRVDGYATQFFNRAVYQSEVIVPNVATGFVDQFGGSTDVIGSSTNDQGVVVGHVCEERTSALAEPDIATPMVRARPTSGVAVGHIENARIFSRDSGNRHDLVWSCYDPADCLIRLNSAGDVAKATSLLDEARCIAIELGNAPLMAKITELQEKFVGRPARALAFPDGLTQREVEVIGLVAAGRMDREMAEDLFISVNTVRDHVRRILNKTDSANRTEAAAYAVRRGLGLDEESDDA